MRDIVANKLNLKCFVKFVVLKNRKFHQINFLIDIRISLVNIKIYKLLLKRILSIKIIVESI